MSMQIEVSLRRGRAGRGRFEGFTLIELLVVISITALLVAILLPALSKARTTAQMSASLSNLRQIQIAQHVYAADNEGIISPPSKMKSGVEYWTSIMCGKGYLAGPDVLWSPARDTSLAKAATPAYKFWAYPGYAVNHYVIPEEATIDTSTGVGGKKRRLMSLDHGDIPPPAKVLVLIEAWRPDAYDWKDGDGLWGLVPQRDPAHSKDASLITYSGSAPRAFMDGHVIAEDSQAIGWLPTDQRNGIWTYTAASLTPVIRHRTPWYADWEYQWR